MFGDLLAPSHVLLILVVALLVLGPKRLPEVGRSLGKGLRDFRDAMTNYNPNTLLNGEDDHEATAATASPPVAAAAATAAPPAQEPEAPEPKAHEATSATEVFPPSQPAKVVSEPEPQDADVIEKHAG